MDGVDDVLQGCDRGKRVGRGGRDLPRERSREGGHDRGRCVGEDVRRDIDVASCAVGEDARGGIDLRCSGGGGGEVTVASQVGAEGEGKG